MVKEFEKNKRYVFDLESYLENSDKYGLQAASWIHECNMKEVNVIDSNVGYVQLNDCTYTILPAWCIGRTFHATKMIIEDGDNF